MKNCVLLTIVVLTLMAAQACAGGTSPAPAAEATAPPVARSPGGAGLAEWDRLAEAGKKENQVAIFTNIRGLNRADLTAAFGARYDIKLEFLVVSRGLELTQRLVTERWTGLFTADHRGHDHHHHDETRRTS